MTPSQGWTDEILSRTKTKKLRSAELTASIAGEEMEKVVWRQKRRQVPRGAAMDSCEGRNGQRQTDRPGRT